MVSRYGLLKRVNFKDVTINRVKGPRIKALTSGF